MAAAQQTMAPMKIAAEGPTSTPPLYKIKRSREVESTVARMSPGHKSVLPNHEVYETSFCQENGGSLNSVDVAVANMPCGRRGVGNNSIIIIFRSLL